MSCPMVWPGADSGLHLQRSGGRDAVGGGRGRPWAMEGRVCVPWSGGQLRRPGSGLGKHRLSSQGHVLGSHRWCRPVVQVSMITFSSQAHDVP